VGPNLTTSEAAKLAGVSIQTIIRQFDEGALRGFVVPGSAHRRIPASHLREWMAKNRIPTQEVDAQFPALQTA